MCVCDETGICPPGCERRPDGAAPWSGHDRYETPRLAYEAETRAEAAQAASDQQERQEGRP